MQFDLFSRILKLILCDSCFCLGGFGLINTFTPMPDRYLYHNAHIPHSFEFILKAVEYGRIGHHIISHQRNGRKMFGAGNVYFLFINLSSQFKAAYLRTVGVSGGHVEVGLRCEQWNVLYIFVCQRDRRAEINAT